MMMEAHAGWGGACGEEGSATSMPSPYTPQLCAQPWPWVQHTMMLCPTWSAADLFSPLAPCRSPASSDTLSDLTSTTILSLRASGLVLGEGGDS